VSIGSALIISLLAWVLGIIDLPVAVICTIGGFIGTNIDSLVGALMENKGLIGNAGTNLLATMGGGVCTVAIMMLLQGAM